MQHHARKMSALAVSGAILLGVCTAVLAQTTTSEPSTTTTTQTPGARTAPSTTTPGTSPAPAARTLNLNAVTVAQLVRAGLDQPSAQLIVQNQPYSKPEDVLEVKGLSDRTKAALKANMDILRAEPAPSAK
ncbi:photosystem II complex extrinsic protein U [Gloeobacter kilaueensis]|uniref:Photosystem II complex extrinsic protein U n=1 Tax=Gloeobacter kilaueensis (strain ATCC BAA-2537 / CCAP 1431/1 / ULC 316 / JS1) TaxID=1183438 RepID=U5QFA5_GLOK1|nr:photosystem II complex extrinsic protein U [Gloeobacter kilaueensis]AGY56335.1 photosystem II complex extrinsic protein U [Gloeobacter kilaueensis JS1]